MHNRGVSPLPQLEPPLVAIEALSGLLSDLYRRQVEMLPRETYLREHSAPAFVRGTVAVYRFYEPWLPREGRILDWGCRHAPDACLIRARFGTRFTLDGCDVFDRASYPVFFEYAGLRYQPLPDAVRLPYADDSFDGVIASGVLEHVPMDYESLKELHRVLKPTGSLYLHCDPTASHYLKVLLDAIFGPENFRNEIMWHYGGRGAKAVASQFPRNHDVLLLYSKADGEQVHNRQYLTRRYTPDEARARGLRQDPDGRWFKTAPRGDYTDDSVSRLEKEGRIHRTRTGSVRVKYFLGGSAGSVEEAVLVGDTWNDIPDAMHLGHELLGYPTQKPLALLERVLAASSNPGDVVLDPFCGCGTALVAAQKLDRRWIGIDVTYLSIAVMRARLKDSFALVDVPVVGQPTEVEGARAMLVGTGLEGQYQFQWWALGLVGARPVEQKKGADHGIDGKVLFRDHPQATKPEQIIIQVKGGKTGVKDVRDLRGVLDREKAAMGVLISLQPPTGPMEAEAASAGFYTHKMNAQQ